MSVTDVLIRITEIQQGLIAKPAAAPANPSGGGSAALGGAASFAELLSGAAPAATAAAPVLPGMTAMPGLPGLTPAQASALNPVPAGTGGQALLAAAQREVGVAEQPPGSNDAPRIAQYRQATAGSGVGPWCAYFTSWAAREAGMPLGENGQGFGRVDDVYAWAQRAGRAQPNGPGVVPHPGDLIVWDEHIGIVEGVMPDGKIATIEGNSSDMVTRRTHEAGSALGYVRMG